ncbi:MAG: DUF4277 domain-containing protein [Thermaerobacterales bacterium]
MEIFHDGPGPVIAAICWQIGLTARLNRLLAWDEAQCRLSPGYRLETLVMNILVDRHPLYELPRFFQEMDTEKLFGSGIRPEDLNDHAVGLA